MQAQQQQQAQSHANVLSHAIPQNCYEYNSVPDAQTNHVTANQHAPHQLQPHPNVNTADHKPQTSKYPSYYDANAQYQDHMQNVQTIQDSSGWNNLTPTLVENQPNQYLSSMRPELQKFPQQKSQQPNVANDTAKMQQQQQQQHNQYQYQNLWPNEPSQIEYAPKPIESSIQKHEQQQQQQPPSNSTTSTTGNSYNSIGNILTNLELLGNNSNLDSSNFELIGSNYDQQYNNSWININKPPGEEW